MSDLFDLETILANSKYLAGTQREPSVVMAKGEGSYLYDINGKQYIDFYAGIAVNSLGHCDPEISQIIADQSSTLLHSANSCPTPWPSKLASLLVEKTKEFGGMHTASNVFFCNSGAEANEAALKFARKYGKSISEDKTEIISFNCSFHGRTMGALSVTANMNYKTPFMPLIPGVKEAVVGDIASVEAIISEKTCAVIIEPLQGEGGVRPVPADFLVALKKLCEKHKTLLIYDEVQCGMGRSGTLWAHSKLPQEGHPDIITSAKALGNGYPIGACIISTHVNDVLAPGDHGTTYGGNPIATRVACNVVERIANKEFLEGVQHKSELLISKITELQAKYPEQIKEIRGQGLMLGVEITGDAKEVLTKARENGLCTIMVAGNVIRLLPALNTPDELIVKAVEILEKTFDEMYGKN